MRARKRGHRFVHLRVSEKRFQPLDRPFGRRRQQALGTGVMGGMIAVAILALLMVPVLFVAVQAAFDRQIRRELKAALRLRLRAARRMKISVKAAGGGIEAV